MTIVDSEIYSTPPTSPVQEDDLALEMFPNNTIRPSLSRRGSQNRPSIWPSLSPLHTDIPWNYGLVVDDVDQQSPTKIETPHHGHSLERDGATRSVPHLESPLSGSSPSSMSTTGSPKPVVMNTNQFPKRSPCFVHSHLDKGASLQDWLREREKEVHHTKPRDRTLCADAAKTVITEIDEDEDHGGSLTRQLAETATGVRELSRQLGRARIRTNIQSVLIVTKARDNRLIKLTRDLALYLMLKPRHGGRGLVVYVDHQLRTSRRFDAAGIQHSNPELFRPVPRRRSTNSSVSSSQDESTGLEEGQLRYWTSDMCARSAHLFDFVITLGGDGTVLFTSWLFQRIVPPVLPFALGSLGFLTNFDFVDYPAVVDSCIDAGIRANLRMRFTCTIYRATLEKRSYKKAVKKGETGEIMMKDVRSGGWEAVEGGWSGGLAPQDVSKCMKDREIMCFTTKPVESFEVLNDLVVDRGPSPYVSLLELFGDEHHMTTVQADGLCVATPTGSTAYSLSAGGSLVHPEIPAMLITPICPHTLSFRPMLLPDSMELRICVPYNSRSTAWASFDGRGRVELKRAYPFPTVCADKQSTDWFHSISRTGQKSFVVVEEGSPMKRIMKEKAQMARLGVNLVEEDEGDGSEDEDEDEDDFDIHDSSPEGPTNGGPTWNDSLSAPELAALALVGGRNMKKTGRSKSRSRSRSGLHSGVDTPGRFAGPTHSPPQISRRQGQYTALGPTPPSPTHSDSSSDSLATMDLAQRGARDDIHNHEHYSSSRSRIPRDRDFEDSPKTPTIPDPTPVRNRQPKSTSRDRHEHQPCRAFAIWGNDESDSNTSDNDN
ncbi:hypothetical protein EDC04DRAFT_2641625 [Pisolithus marmoratus]|nr:hypothetical protein EDC04DRAFT_2641625 [Pisolithus marmoratus]